MKVLGLLVVGLVALTTAEDATDTGKVVAKRGALYSGHGAYGYGHGYGYGYPVVSTAVVHSPIVSKSYYGGLGHGYYGGLGHGYYGGLGHGYYGGYGGYYGLGHGNYYPAYSYSSVGLGHGLDHGYYGHGYW